jgi:hypothetical protein
MRQATALWAATETFEQELPIRDESVSEPITDDMNISLVQLGEVLSPDAVPELSDVKAATHLDDTGRLMVPVAGPVT